MVRIAILTVSLAALLAQGSGCTCSDPDPCPAEYQAGEPCEVLGLECPPPNAKCTGELASSCVCSDEYAGGFTWDCHKVKYCKCYCDCGSGDAGFKRVAENTCEALGCVNDPTKPCPKIAANVCWAVCLDRDSGPDAPLPDAKVNDAGPDGAKPDAPVPDAPAIDAPAADAGVD